MSFFLCKSCFCQMKEKEVKLALNTNCFLQTINLAKKFAQLAAVKVKVRDSGCKHTLFRPFSIVGPLQFSITND